MQVAPTEVTFRFRYEINGRDVTTQLSDYLSAERRLRQVRTSHERTRREALEALHDAGLSQRAMADVVGLSHQRVNQLIA